MSNTETMHAAFTAWVEREVPAWKYWSPNEQLAARSGFYAASAGKAELVEALTRVCQVFPTDDDMAQAGWNPQEIEAACTAYDKARAAISRATGEQE